MVTQQPTPELPPGVRWPVWAQSLALVVGFDRFARWCAARFGPMFTLRAIGLGEVVVVNDPALIREVLTDRRGVYRAGEANARLLGGIGPSSILVLDGPEHLRRRRLLLPPFHGEAVRGYAQRVTEIAAEEAARWPVGRPFALLPRMRAITLEVMLRAVIGVRDEQRRDRLRDVLQRVLRVNPLFMTLEVSHPGLAESRLGRLLPLMRARRELDRLVYEEIAAHRADRDDRDDILALLLAARDEAGAPLSDEQVRDELLTLLGAGSETSSSTLAWCFERLLRHPAALQRLRQELDAGSESYLEAVINETLRVRPALSSANRVASEAVVLGGYQLPAGTLVALSIWGVQHSDAYADPDEFRPERLLGRAPEPYTLIPFGGGERRCIGASFAMMEMKEVLRTVLRHGDLQARGAKAEGVSRTRSVTFVPSRGARVVLTARR